MSPVKHLTNNHVFGAPDSMKDCVDLPVTCTMHLGHGAIKSYWQPSEEDIANILAGGKVCLYIIGNGMPPVAMAVEL